MATKLNKVLVTASTFPAHENDPVAPFVRDQVIAMHKAHPETQFDVLAPHNAHTATSSHTKHKDFTEYRFHYFWPFTSLELLTGRSIAPALKQNPLLYLQVPFLLFATIFATWRHIVRHSPDIVYAHWFTPQGIAAAIACTLTGKKFVFTSHSGDVIILKNIPFSRILVKWVCNRASAYTAVSQQTADKLLSMLPSKKKYRNKLSIIPMGTSISTNYNNVSRNEKTIKLLFIGRLVSIKGVDYLLRAIAGLKEYDFHLTVAGDGQQRADLEHLADELELSNKVSFVGFVSGATKYNLLNEADIVCIPSVKEGDNTEGLPVTFMEAAAAGKVIVASDVTGAQEYLTDGKNGFIFRQASVVDLRSKLKEVFDTNIETWNDIGMQAYNLSRVFDWRVVAKRHYEILEKAL